jgi:hypothetical protein
MRIKKYNNFIKESLIYDLIGDRYYQKIESPTIHQQILSDSDFEIISEEESNEYLPLIKSFVDKEAKESGINKNKYFFSEKHSDIFTWNRITDKKIERWVYQFSWKSGKVPSFSFCYVYKLPDDFIMIHFWIIGISFSEIYLIDTYGGIEQFKKDKIDNKSNNKLNESLSSLIGNNLYKELKYESEIRETYYLKKEEMLKIEKEEIEYLMENYLEKFETQLIKINKPRDNTTMCFELENGDITFEKYDDEYFHIYMEMPIVIIGHERYCDTRGQTKEFICDSLEGIKKWASEDPLKLYYPQVYHSLK